MIAVLQETWAGRRVLLTGGHEPLGRWMRTLLETLGATVYIPEEDRADTTGWALAPLRHAMMRYKPDAWICTSFPATTALDATCEAMRVLSNRLAAAHDFGIRGVLLLMRDCVYRNDSAPWACREQDPLGGKDAEGYALSCLRLLAEGYRRGFWQEPLPVVIAHHGALLYGGMQEDVPAGTWIRALSAGNKPLLSYPDVMLPFQHALDPLAGMLLALGRVLRLPLHKGDTWNFGAPAQNWCTARTACKVLADGFGAQSAPDVESAGTATHPPRLESEKACKQLGWRTLYDAEQSLQLLAAWQALADAQGGDAACAAQVNDYLAEAGRLFG